MLIADFPSALLNLRQNPEIDALIWELGLTSEADYERNVEAAEKAKQFIYDREADAELRKNREFHRNFSRYPLFREQVRVQLAEAFPMSPPQEIQLELF